MANKRHVKILMEEGVQAWNRWRESTNETPELDQKEFHAQDFRDIDLTETSLFDVCFSDCKLAGAKFNKSALQKSIFRFCDLRNAQFVESRWEGSTLHRTDFSHADFTSAEFSHSFFEHCEFRHSNAKNANFFRSSLSNSFCDYGDFSNASFWRAVIDQTSFAFATLTRADFRLSTRIDWNIKGVICESAWTDDHPFKLSYFQPEEFEKLYGSRLKLRLVYPGGIDTLEVVTLSALVTRLERSRQGIKLELKAIEQTSVGAVAVISVDTYDNLTDGEARELRSNLEERGQNIVEMLRKELREKTVRTAALEANVVVLNDIVDKLIQRGNLSIWLTGGIGNVSEYKTEIAGNFQGTIGDSSQATDLTYNQTGDQFKESIDMVALARELLCLRAEIAKQPDVDEHKDEVKALAVAESAANDGDSSKLVSALKGAGKWTLDIATKIGSPVLTEYLERKAGVK